MDATEMRYLEDVLALHPMELERPNTQAKDNIMISQLLPSGGCEKKSKRTDQTTEIITSTQQDNESTI